MLSSHRKAGLDLVRASAILLVLLDHGLSFYAGSFVPSAFRHPLGILGVEAFFVLSGYLIGGILLKSIAAAGNHLTVRGLGDFWFRRWARTLPAYFLFLILTALLFGTDGRWLRYLTFTQNLTHGPRGFFLISWSLAIEEWFYLLFPALIFFGRLVLPRTRHAFFSATFLLLAVPLLLRLTLGEGRSWDYDVRKVVVMRLDAIMYGILIAGIERYRPAWFDRLRHLRFLSFGAILASASLAWIVWRFATGGENFASRPSDSLNLVVLSAGAALTLPFFSTLRLAPSLALSGITKVSLWSYSLYLCHIQGLQLLRHAAQAWQCIGPFEPVLAFLLIFVVAALTFHFIEDPILQFRDRISRKVKSAQGPVAEKLI